MKKLSSFTPLIATALFFSVLFWGCKKEISADSLTPQEEQEAATDASTSEADAEFTFNDVFDNVMGVNSEVGIGGAGIFGRVMTNGRMDRTDSNNRCFIVTITPQQQGVFPKTVVIDFGNGCSTQGHTRSGKITIVYTGPLLVPGNSATTTFSNFTIDGLTVQGTHKITNTSTAPGTTNYQRQFTVDVTDAKITKQNGNYIQWESHRVSTQSEGSVTLIPQDDIFKLTGSAQGKVKDGDKIFAWTSEIKEPLVKKFICPWISKGTLHVVRVTLATNSQWAATLDYGNGDCDNKATLTINGNTQQIMLH